MKSRISRHRALTTVGAVFLSLIFAQLPNTSAPAVVYCIGPAAYPPDLPDCLDPVVEAQKVAKQQADGSFLVQGVVYSTTALNAALVAMYGAENVQVKNKEEKQEAANDSDLRAAAIQSIVNQ